MIIYLISLVAMAIAVFLVIGIIYKIFWTVFDNIRGYLHYRCGIEYLFTTEEKIAHGIIEPISYEPEVIVLNRDTQTHEEFWENMNTSIDVQIKQSTNDPNEIFFQGRVKRRR